MKNNFNILLSDLIVNCGSTIIIEYELKKGGYKYDIHLTDTNKKYCIYSIDRLELFTKKNYINELNIYIIQVINYGILEKNIYKINRIKNICLT